MLRDLLIRERADLRATDDQGANGAALMQQRCRERCSMPNSLCERPPGRELRCLQEVWDVDEGTIKHGAPRQEFTIDRKRRREAQVEGWTRDLPL